MCHNGVRSRELDRGPALAATKQNTDKCPQIFTFLLVIIRYINHKSLSSQIVMCVYCLLIPLPFFEGGAGIHSQITLDRVTVQTEATLHQGRFWEVPVG